MTSDPSDAESSPLPCSCGTSRTPLACLPPCRPLIQAKPNLGRHQTAVELILAQQLLQGFILERWPRGAVRAGHAHDQAQVARPHVRGGAGEPLRGGVPALDADQVDLKGPPQMQWPALEPGRPQVHTLAIPDDRLSADVLWEGEAVKLQDELHQLPCLHDLLLAECSEVAVGARRTRRRRAPAPALPAREDLLQAGDRLRHELPLGYSKVDPGVLLDGGSPTRNPFKLPVPVADQEHYDSQFLG
mmetsp:Transcript_44214/g.127951  ORF Transcript_44214/g.127951 Transcript_44214/m.127951 type:complete len:245 (+) Transcript_44214:197-931(+)